MSGSVFGPESSILCRIVGCWPVASGSGTRPFFRVAPGLADTLY
ncbi:MAG: hypothetical protein ABF577_06225 [Acetobacter sp.]